MKVQISSGKIKLQPDKNGLNFTGNGSILDNKFHLINLSFGSNGINFRIDGQQDFSSSDVTSLDLTQNQSIALGSKYPSPYWSGQQAEVIAFKKSLTEAEKISVENYLNQKYGLAEDGITPVLDQDDTQTDFNLETLQVKFYNQTTSDLSLNTNQEVQVKTPSYNFEQNDSRYLPLSVLLNEKQGENKEFSLKSGVVYTLQNQSSSSLQSSSDQSFSSIFSSSLAESSTISSINSSEENSFSSQNSSSPNFSSSVSSSSNSVFSSSTQSFTSSNSSSSVSSSLAQSSTNSFSSSNSSTEPYLIPIRNNNTNQEYISFSPNKSQLLPYKKQDLKINVRGFSPISEGAVCQFLIKQNDQQNWTDISGDENKYQNGSCSEVVLEAQEQLNPIYQIKIKITNPNIGDYPNAVFSSGLDYMFAIGPVSLVVINTVN